MLTLLRFSLPILLVAALATIVQAGSNDSMLFARTNYWQGFVDFWSGSLRKQNGVVLFALGVAAVSLFIITRGKWKK